MSNIVSLNRHFESLVKKLPKPSTFHQQMVYDRMVGKFCIPDASQEARLKTECFTNWVQFDSTLSFTRIPALYRVRLRLHEWLKDFRVSKDVQFTPGEHSIPGRGAVSVEAKLSRPWAVTPSCFDRFARIVYEHKALKRAARKKMQRVGFDDRWLWRVYGDAFRIFKFKLSFCVKFVQGGRFSSVPKNNAKRRAINIEPFGNILVQRQIGLGLSSLLTRLGNDLPTGQDRHRRLISKRVNTIDLSSASDSISVELARFLLPKWFFRLLDSSRSFGVYHEGCFYVTKKLSAMGNGFTFELMTLIILAITRELDECSSVYGDDIITTADPTPLLEAAGFKVNMQKTFLYRKERESCGAFYEEGVGYLLGYDFRYVSNETEAVVFLNKLLALSRGGPIEYREVLGSMHSRLIRYMEEFRFCDVGIPLLEAPFVVDPSLPFPTQTSRKVRALAKRYQLRVAAVRVPFQKPELRTPTFSDIRPGFWAKYEMYLHACRRTDDPGGRILQRHRLLFLSSCGALNL